MKSMARDRALIELRNYLSYSPETGEFVWIKKPSTKQKIGRAGSINRSYRRIKFMGFCFQEHRLAWFFFYGKWPTLDIDHINGVPSDNRIKNIREVPHKLNQTNLKIHRQGRHIGVQTVRDRWKAVVPIAFTGSRRKHLGTFQSEDCAARAVKSYLKERGISYG